MSTLTYARFWRCALQVNPSSYAATYRAKRDGLPEAEYNQAIVEQCKQHNIAVVGIADHGNVDGVDSLRASLNEAGIVVFPGFEIASTEKVHLVCLFPETTTKATLTLYLGRLGITDPSNGALPSNLSCVEIAKQVSDLGGFMYAAHIASSSGLLDARLSHAWTECDHIRVAQIPGSIDKLDEAIRTIVLNKNREYKRERPIVLINAKDVAKPEDLAHPSATCLVKMTVPNFEAFKVAFHDAESRIRLNSDVRADTQSKISAITIQGGYLDGVKAELSDHLNTLIGGRGTGKSTLIECLRYAFELAPANKQALKTHQDIVKENLGSASGSISLTLTSAAQHGRTFTITRRYAEPPIVLDEAGNVSKLQPRDLMPHLEIYGQNEIYELARDPQSRVQLLRRCVPLDVTADATNAQLRKRLAENRQSLLKAITRLEEHEEQLGKLPKLSEQLKEFERLGVSTKLARAPLFAREKQIVARVEETFTQLDAGVEAIENALPDLAFLGDHAIASLPNHVHLASMRQALEAMREQLSAHINAFALIASQGKTAIAPIKANWQSALDSGQRELETVLAGLPSMSGKGGAEIGTAYKTLTQEIERLKPLESQTATLTLLRTTLEQERANLLAELSAARTRRAAEWTQAVKELNGRLGSEVRVKLSPEADTQTLVEFLVASALENVGEKRLASLNEQSEVKPLALVKAIREGRTQLQSQFKLTTAVADSLSKMTRQRLLELEELELGDRVEIELNLAPAGKHDFRALERLSIGQQCTAILHLLLLDNQDPLVIDQPEDNLDNAFIANRIVRALRSAKTERQFLFSTHNANIPVFGDAEWIGIVSAHDQKGHLAPGDQGSIDVPAIRDKVAALLEGGKEAFMLRKDKYDF